MAAPDTVLSVELSRERALLAQRLRAAKLFEPVEDHSYACDRLDRRNEGLGHQQPAPIERHVVRRRPAGTGESAVEELPRRSSFERGTERDVHGMHARGTRRFASRQIKQL